MCHLKVRLGSSRLPNLASACSVNLSRNTFEEQLGLHGQGCPFWGADAKAELVRVRPAILDLWSSHRLSDWNTSIVDKKMRGGKLKKNKRCQPALFSLLSTFSLRTYYYRPSRRRFCRGCRLEDLVSDGSGQPGLEDHWSDGLDWPRGLGVHSPLVDGSSTHEIGGSNPPSPTKIGSHMK